MSKASIARTRTTLADVMKIKTAIEAAGFDTFVVAHASEAALTRAKRQRRTQIRKVRHLIQLKGK